MKFDELVTAEAMHGGNMSTKADQYASHNMQSWKDNGTNIADMDNYSVIHYNGTYSIWDKDVVIACATIDSDTVENVWVKEDYRGQKLFSKLLWFFFTRLNYDKLFIGNTIHSTAMQEVLSTIRMPKFWVNTVTSEVDKYDPTYTEKYYQFPWTDWKLLIDNTQGFKDWPMRNGNGFVTEGYSNIFESD